MWANLIPLPYRILIMAALLISGVLFGYVQGLTHASSTCEVNNARAQQSAQIRADKITTKREAVARRRETTREQIRIVYRTIREKADETPIASNCGLDADGLRLWNAANAGATAPVRSEPDRALPGSAVRSFWRFGRIGTEPYRGDGALPPVPRPDGETDGVLK